MHAQRTDEGLVVDRAWITRMYGLTPEWCRKALPVHAYDQGRALHLITPEVARRLATTRRRRRRGGAR